MNSQERVESLLLTIDQLGVAKIKHLQQIHDLKSYRNACRVVKQLGPYINETYHNKEKVIYLNKVGRNLIGSDKEIKNSNLLEHTLLGNEVYIHHNKPVDWKTEHVIEVSQQPEWMKAQGLKITGKKIVCDATFTRNGYMYLVEIDNTRSMIDNKKKIQMYSEVMPKLKNNISVLLIYTSTNERKIKFESWINQAKIRGEIRTFEEIR